MSVKTDLSENRTEVQSTVTTMGGKMPNKKMTGQSNKHTTKTNNPNEFISEFQSFGRLLYECAIDELRQAWLLAPVHHETADLPRHLYRCRLDD